MQLKPHTTLQDGKYEIIRVLGQGGFGITYLAEQTLVDRKVCIKEFFIKEYCERDETSSQVSLGTTSNAEMMRQYMAKFIKEAKTIAKLDHPNIVKIFDVFKENNTAYIVMEYLDGQSLGEQIKQYGPLDEGKAISYMRIIGSALSYAHSQHVMHLDVKPSNIMYDKTKERPVLIDFGLAKQYTEGGEQTSSTPVGISQGYAPMEQYKAGGVKEFSPATDIYSLGATLYSLVSGDTPPAASDVSEDGVPKIAGLSEGVMHAIESAMQPRRKDRPQSVDEFLALLDAPVPDAGRDKEETVIIPPKPTDDSSSVAKKGLPSWIYGVVAAVVVAIGIFLLWPKGGGSDIGAASQPDSTAVAQVATKEPVASSEPPVKQEPSVVAVKEVKISKSKLELQEGETASLSATVNPSDATEKAVTWKSTNESVAKVSNGRVTAVKAGSAAVIASSGGKEAYCNVTVSAKPSPVQTESRGTGTISGHEWVDLGLSVKWATCNVGAASPGDYGNYYAWGETSPKSEYSWSNLKYCLDDNGDRFSKYVASSKYGSVDNKTRLDMSDDAARYNWGGSWRMPTDAEWTELRTKCTWSWTTQNGHNGYKVTSKSNGTSIFLPAAGYRLYTYLNDVGSWGYYWSSSLNSLNGLYPGLAFGLRFYSSDVVWGTCSRFNGFTVRPVTE